ncbi:hypothetical protein D3C75_575780 [compost metagenome]
MPASWASTPRTTMRLPPAATLFMVIIDSTVTLGNGLKCMAAVQNPPIRESSTRLRCSAW